MEKKQAGRRCLSARSVSARFPVSNSRMLSGAAIIAPEIKNGSETHLRSEMIVSDPLPQNTRTWHENAYASLLGEVLHHLFEQLHDGGFSGIDFQEPERQMKDHAHLMRVAIEVEMNGESPLSRGDFLQWHPLDFVWACAWVSHRGLSLPASRRVSCAGRPCTYRRPRAPLRGLLARAASSRGSRCRRHP